MPFKSEKQRKWMHANEPEMADKWEKEEESVNEQKKMTPIQKIEKLAKANKYGEVDGMRLNGKTANTIMKVYNHPKVKQFHRKLDSFKSHEIIDTLLNLTKVLGIKEDRDYKAEYKKFQSSTKSKKYRAELNKYNRQKGTYGNGDKKDASHKGGKIVGFEAESKNRGRAEKSRLKKEAITINEGGMGILSTDQADVLQGIVMRNKSKNLKAILSIVIKDKMFKGVDKKELLGYIDGARQFVKYMKSNPMESVNEAEMIHVLTKDIGKKKMNDLVQFLFNVLDLAPNKDFRLSSNGKILSVNVDKINSKSIQNIKKRYGVDLQSHLGFQVRAIEIAINMAGNMTGAVKKIEKIKRGLSKDKKVADVLRKMNESVNEADLGLTYKKGKTVKVTHNKSGKEIVIVDKPNVRKEYEKIGFYAESVNEISGVDLAKKVLKDKQHEKGIDLQTANLIVTIDKAYDKKPALQKKFRAIPLPKMKQMIMKYYR